MKKLTALLLALITIATLLSACGNPENLSDREEKPRLKIVCTIFPEYDWVREILGRESDEAELTLLLDKGVDLHSYQPTADDMVKISDCDLFIYVGGESDAWVEDALKNVGNQKMKVVRLMEELGDAVKTEESVEGMQEEDEEHSDEEEEEEKDEHVWLSLRNAEILVRAIARNLGEINPAKSESYTANAEAYVKKLDALDRDYQKAAEASPHKTLLFGDRFPFRYLTEDYQLNYYAAFAGCSAETEASFETISFLSKKVDELNLPAVLCLEGREHKIAEGVVKNSEEKNQKILRLDSMQSISSKDVESGVNYLSIMEKNLDVLKEALK